MEIVLLWLQIVLFVCLFWLSGGAVELTLIGSEHHSSSNSSSSSSGDSSVGVMKVFGYVALFGNTFCMVSIVAGVL